MREGQGYILLMLLYRKWLDFYPEVGGGPLTECILVAKTKPLRQTARSALFIKFSHAYQMSNLSQITDMVARW